MDKKDRVPGYYWVKPKDIEEWDSNFVDKDGFIIAIWFGKGDEWGNGWFIPSFPDMMFSDSDFVEIDERRIIR